MITVFSNWQSIVFMEQLRTVDIERANFAMHCGIYICIMSICCNHAHPAWFFLQFGQQLWLMLVVGIDTLQTHLVQRSYRIFIAEWFPGGSFAQISTIFRHLPCHPCTQRWSKSVANMLLFHTLDTVAFSMIWVDHQRILHTSNF